MQRHGQDLPVHGVTCVQSQPEQSRGKGQRNENNTEKDSPSGHWITPWTLQGTCKCVTPSRRCWIETNPDALGLSTDG